MFDNYYDDYKAIPRTASEAFKNEKGSCRYARARPHLKSDLRMHIFQILSATNRTKFATPPHMPALAHALTLTV